MAPHVKALVVDVFGTVVDWRGGFTRAFAAAGLKDAARLADAWHGAYRPALDRIRGGAEPWQKLDPLVRRALDGLLAREDVLVAEEARRQIARAWERLDPWPDAVAGLLLLKRRFIIGTLSNGSVAQLVNLAKFAGLPWDVVFSAELVRHYKPDPETYLSVPSYLGLDPAECMLVAAHAYDLRAARGHGLKTGYVARPLEYGPDHAPETFAPGEFDVVARDLLDLAERLGV
jgi:2-haloacid dehalogenase